MYCKKCGNELVSSSDGQFYVCHSCKIKYEIPGTKEKVTFEKVVKPRNKDNVLTGINPKILYSAIGGIALIGVITGSVFTGVKLGEKKADKADISLVGNEDANYNNSSAESENFNNSKINKNVDNDDVSDMSEQIDADENFEQVAANNDISGMIYSENASFSRDDVEITDEDIYASAKVIMSNSKYSKELSMIIAKKLLYYYGCAIDSFKHGRGYMDITMANGNVCSLKANISEIEMNLLTGESSPIYTIYDEYTGEGIVSFWGLILRNDQGSQPNLSNDFWDRDFLGGINYGVGGYLANVPADDYIFNLERRNLGDEPALKDAQALIDRLKYEAYSDSFQQLYIGYYPQVGPYDITEPIPTLYNIYKVVDFYGNGTMIPFSFGYPEYGSIYAAFEPRASIVRELSSYNYVITMDDEIYIGNGNGTVALVRKSFDYNTDTYSEKIIYYKLENGDFVLTEGKYSSKEELDNSGEYQLNRISSDSGWYLYEY